MNFITYHRIKIATGFLLSLFISCSASLKHVSKSWDEAISSKQSATDSVDKVNLSEYVKIEQYLPANHSKKGDVDYTEALQNAIDVYDKVIFPNFPVLVNTEGIQLRSNTAVYFPPDAKLILKSSNAGAYGIVKLRNVQNVLLYNPRIEGDRNRRLDPTNSKGEWGMGLWIRGARNVTIYNPAISSCWGDGIYIGSLEGAGPSENIRIYDAFITDSRRNGISITSGRNIELIRPYVEKSTGVNPQAGIDIEPNSNDDVISGISVVEPTTHLNGRIGIVISLGRLVGPKEKEVFISIENHKDTYAPFGFVMASIREGDTDNYKKLKGNIQLVNPKYILNERPVALGYSNGYYPPISFHQPEIYTQGTDSIILDKKKMSELIDIKYDSSVQFILNK